MDESQYVEFKKQAAEGLLSAANQFDKAILTLAAGALAISLTFVKDIAAHPDPATVRLLGCAWSGFIGSILFTLLSFQASMFAFQRHDRIIDTICANPDIDRSQLGNPWSAVTIVLNALSLVAFVAGTLLLTFAVYSNL